IASAVDETPLNVVVLHGINFFLPSNLAQDQAMRDSLVTGMSRRIEFYPEALESRLMSRQYEAELVAFLQQKYKDTKIDLVLAVGTHGLDFVEANRAELWPGASVVFYGVGKELILNRSFGPGITGQTAWFDIGGTIDLAVRLQPAARRVVVV